MALVTLGAPSVFAESEAEGEDDIIIIIDDEPEASPAVDPSDDEILIIVDDDDDTEDEILIEDDGDASADEAGTGFVAELPRIRGALGGVWEAFHAAFDSELSLSAQPVALTDGPIRSLAQLHVESWILPAPNLSFFADAIARFAVDTSGQTVSAVAVLDVYEAYAKVNLGVGAVQLGRLVLPWGRTQVAALGDRLNPVDHRRGPSFVDPVRGKQPQYGVSLRSSLGEVSFEGVALVAFEPTEGSLAASDQGGVQLNRYQGALIRSPARAGGLLDGDERASITAPLDPLQTMTLGVRARRRVGDVDVGVSLVWGMDETPTLNFDPDVARFLAREAYAERGVPVADLPLNPCSTSVGTCIGPQSIGYARTASAVVNAEWGLGVVILKGEFLAQPNLENVGVPSIRGKNTILVSEDGLTSRGLSHYAVAVAAEAGFFEWVTGSLEVFDRMWVGVPQEQNIWGVELLTPDPLPERIVHRFALGASLHGTVLDNAVHWRLRGEAGVLQPDVLVHAQVQYLLPVFDLYLGARAQGFTGFPGSPGWMRQDASSIAIFVGEGR